MIPQDFWRLKLSYPARRLEALFRSSPLWRNLYRFGRCKYLPSNINFSYWVQILPGLQSSLRSSARLTSVSARHYTHWHLERRTRLGAPASLLSTRDLITPVVWPPVAPTLHHLYVLDRSTIPISGQERVYPRLLARDESCPYSYAGWVHEVPLELLYIPRWEQLTWQTRASDFLGRHV
jgi:hypothetical protein